MPLPPPDPRHGLIVHDQFMNWSDIERRYLCRRCRSRIGKPYADPLTGVLDFDRIVCHGIMEHEISEEGDLIAAGQVDWQKDNDFWTGVEVAGHFGHRAKRTDNSIYDDPNFEGW